MYPNSFIFLFLSLSCTAYSDFTVNPRDVEEFSNVTAEFECHYTRTDADVDVHVSWVVNGTSLNRTPSNMCEIRNSVGVLTQNQSIIVSTLSIATTLECNNTEVCCTAILVTGSGIPTTEKSDLAVLHVQEIEIVHSSFEVFSNGTVLIVWDPSFDSTTLINNEYDILIVDNVTGNTIDQINSYSPDSKMTDGQSQQFSYSGTYNEITGHCATLTVFITPIINELNTFSGKRTTLIQDLDTIEYVRRGNVTLIDGDVLEFRYYLPKPMPFCNYSLTAVDNISNKSILIDKTRKESGSTDVLTFRVRNSDLRFNRHYIAGFSINNTHSAQTVQSKISLSTFDIQNVSRGASNIVISFVRNTTAQGAFIVCSNDDSFYKPNYTVAEIRDDTVIVVNGIISEVYDNRSCFTSCNISAYDIKSNGLMRNDLSDLEDLNIRPAVERQSMTCVMPCGEQTVTNNEITTNNLVDVTVSKDGHIRFECNVAEADTELLGCISIIHNSADYSTLLVRTISKENSTETVEVNGEMSDIYYVVFEWKRSGIIGSNVLKKGTLSVNVANHKNLSTTTIVSVTVTVVIGVIFTIILSSLIVAIKIKFSKRKFSQRGHTCRSTEIHEIFSLPRNFPKIQTFKVSPADSAESCPKTVLIINNFTFEDSDM